MRGCPLPLALQPCLPTELLSYILAQQSYPTYLFICSTRAAFLSQLLQAAAVPLPVRIADPPVSSPSPETVPHLPPDEEDPSPAPGSDDATEQLEFTQSNEALPPPPTREVPPDTPIPTKHHLLTPTLAQVLSSRHIHLSFLPTLSHLRAHIAVFPAPSAPEPSHGRIPLFEHPGKHSTPLICVYGLVEAHKETSEWSAQGLGSTVAALVDAASRVGARIVLVEFRSLEEEEVGEEKLEEDGLRAEEDAGTEGDEEDGDSKMEEASATSVVPGSGDEGEMKEESEKELKRGEEVWKQRMPLLNGSTRRGGPESADFGSRTGTAAAWSGRTVEVGSVLRRWCRFEVKEW